MISMHRKKYRGIRRKFSVIKKHYPPEFAKWSKVNRVLTLNAYLEDPKAFMVSKKHNIFKKPPVKKKKRKRNRFLPQKKSPHEEEDNEKIRYNEDGSLLRYSFIGKEADFMK